MVEVLPVYVIGRGNHGNGNNTHVVNRGNIGAKCNGRYLVAAIIMGISSCVAFSIAIGFSVEAWRDVKRHEGLH